MKQIYYTNPNVTTTTTTTAEALEYNETVITVTDAYSFSANDYILVEAQGNEYNELLKISTVDSSTQITLTSGIQYPHVSGITLTKLTYNKYLINKSTDGSTYTILTTDNFDYSNKYDRLEYYDDLGLDSYYYQIYFYNDNDILTSVTTTDSGDLFTKSSHGLSDGDTVFLSSIVTTTGILTTKVYYVISSDSTTFQLSLTSGGSAVALTSDGTCSVTPITLQDTLNNQDNFSWITLAKFQAESGLSSSYSSYAIEALMFGVEAMRDDLMFNKILSTTDQDVSFDLNLEGFYLADFNGDRTIDKNDMIIYEYDAENNLRTYLNHKVVKVFIDNPKIVFNSTVPTSGSLLYIETPVAQVPYSNYKRSYEEINKLYAINYLLGDKVPDVVKNAILDWTAGGTTVTRNPDATSKIIEDNTKKIQTLMKDLMLKTYIGKTKLRTQKSSLNIRTPAATVNKGISTPAGNSYWY